MSRKIKTILIGTSLNPPSDDVVKAGLGLARAAGARICLVHAFLPQIIYAGGGAPFVTPLLADEVIRSERMLLTRRLDEQVKRLGIRPEELAGTVLEYGPPHRFLIDTAQKVGADLIVVGATESPRMAKLFGSTAERVVRKATRPVLTVRGTRAMPPKRVLLPVDLSPLSADAFRQGLRVLDQILPARDAALEAFFVMTEYDRQGLAPEAAPELSDANAGRELSRFVETNAKNTGWTVATKVSMGYADEEILARMEEWAPDLIVLGTHGRGGFERFLLGSVASSVVRNAGTSVLVIPPEAALEESLAR
ncbi:MAG TPA: universal stress protein, partial [Thermoanaerobaculia bacterium]|nr:universal stress protein [Thermoanaerobaculia bacterium]